MAKMNESERREAAKATIKGAIEPRLTQMDYRQNLLDYMNYHNTSTSDKDKRKYLHTSLAGLGFADLIPIADKASDYEIRQVSVLMRARDRGDYMDKKHVDLITKMLEDLIDKYDPDNQPEEEDKGPVETTEERNYRIARHLYADVLQGVMDEYVNNGRSDFNMKTWLLLDNVTVGVAEELAYYFVDPIMELKDALEGKDPQLKEAYGHLSKKELNDHIIWLQSCLQACIDRSTIVKATRKPRVVKAKPKASPVAKLKYQRSDPNLGLNSVNPETLIGADEIYAYRANRKFIYWKAEAGKKLEIKGQSVLNYDVNLSGSKTVRKPNDLFKGLNTAKKSLFALFDNLSTARGSAPNRISDDMILIKAF